MAAQGEGAPVCPRCGGAKVTLCGESIDYRPEEWPGQPLPERELHTLAYQCDCGLAFTKTNFADRDGKSAQ